MDFNTNQQLQLNQKIKKNINKKKILVISGGGIKGLSALGALKCLFDYDIIDKPEIYAGTSIGACGCFLLNIGYDPKDIYDVYEEINYVELIKYIEPDNLLLDPCFGLSTPERVLQMIYTFMKKKKINKNITFSQLFELTKSKLIITGTCLNNMTTYYFSKDTYPNMQVLKAIRISISIPFIFRPYTFEKKIWVDGSVMNNFPIDLFNDRLDEVIGIYLDDNYENMDEINEFQDYFFRIFKCAYRGLDYNKVQLFKKYIIHVITEGHHSTNWEIKKEDKKMLYDLGWNSALEYIQKNFL
jgi:predicted acylesterase/phospholipase RssA